MILDKFDLSGRSAIVTGGGRGIGRAIALALAEAGADLLITARSLDQLEETAQLIAGRGRRAVVVRTDVTDSAQVNEMAARAFAEFGQVDILVNNAGGGSAGFGMELQDLPDDIWGGGIDNNLSSVFYCSRAIVPRMAERGSGVVINNASGYGLRGGRNNFIYAAAKGGVIQFTRSLCLTYAARGIRANALLPGAVPHNEAMAAGFHHGKFIPIGRPGTVEDMAMLAVFLASDASAHMNGEVVISDGGALAAGIAPTGMAPLWDA